MLRHAPRASILVILLAGFGWTQVARAQMRIAARPGANVSHHVRTPQALLVGSPFWMDSYPAPYPNTPAVIVVQTPAAPAEHNLRVEDEPKSAPPLVIEWQGDRYVRRSETSPSSARATQPDYIADAKLRRRTADASQQPELPPTTFIFRDGHREESSDYSIISGVVYARGDYWTTGSWTKQIALIQLDLPATFKANQERGVPFRLPAAPNEVITRP